MKKHKMPTYLSCANANHVVYTAHGQNNQTDASIQIMLQPVLISTPNGVKTKQELIGYFFLQKLPSAPDECNKWKGNSSSLCAGVQASAALYIMAAHAEKTKENNSWAHTTFPPVPDRCVSKTISLLIMLNEHSFCSGLICISSDDVNQQEHE